MNAHLGVQVGRWLQQKGYGLSTVTRIPVDSSAFAVDVTKGIGILLPKHQESRFLGNLLNLWSRREFLGCIWFSNPSKRANAKSWTLSVYGKAHLSLAHEIARQLVADFQVSVSIQLELDAELTEDRFPILQRVPIWHF
jgi:hypothetical protein